MRSEMPAGVRTAPTGGHATLDYPIQPSKVQAPPLRDETLARERLLDWLSVKVHSRVVLLVAEAGYGKTTLLADFSRRTRVRVLWYRLDRGDRDWVGFIAHLVAAVRVHVPSFGPATVALLRETATSAPPIDIVLEALLRELASLPNDPTAIVFDDVHLVDDSPDIKLILRELLARGPERMSFIFASRREPPVRLARLRALGEVAELDTDDLRFDAAETERLFRDTYEMPLEPSVLAELSRRTEGWAASLQLVRAAIHDRNPAQVRTFISSLSGAEGHLYEYLAEEVIGDLPEDLQQFLMRTSLLDTIDLTLGPVAAGVTESEARAFIDSAERHGLLGRRGRDARHVTRAHPLVRDFLVDRLTRCIGAAGVREIHLSVARAAEQVAWYIAARHYASAFRPDESRRVLSESIEAILASGAYVAANDLATALDAGGIGGPIGLVLASRIAQQRGAAGEGLALAQLAREADPSSNAVLANLAAAHVMSGDAEGSLNAARLLELSAHPEFAKLGTATVRTLEAAIDGNLDAAEKELKELADSLLGRGASHYLGVALLDASLIDVARGAFSRALEVASDAIVHLSLSSGIVELASAHVAHASAQAFLGDIAAARTEVAMALDKAPPGLRAELAAEFAEVEALVGETRDAWPYIDRAGRESELTDEFAEQLSYARALLHFRDGDIAAARSDVTHFEHRRPLPVVAFEARRFLAEARVAVNDADAIHLAKQGSGLAWSQGAWFWAAYGDCIASLADTTEDPSSKLLAVLEDQPAAVSAAAEMVICRLVELTPMAFAAIVSEAERRPWRWRPPVREALTHADARQFPVLASVLERIGEKEDIPRLRAAARRHRSSAGSRIGLALSRKLASPVFVEDLGRVQILVGQRVVEGSDVRRKVLALLCLLLTKPDFAATRDEVLDSLWPDHDPASALNSLNQTVYFLRRVFEEDFSDEVSPGYVGQDGETIWLDSELIESRSRRCLRIVRSMPGNPTPEGSVELAATYRGPFALDFAYEEWSSQFRDSLHAAYLRVVEHAVRLDLDGGHFERGTFIAERAIEVDPDSEEIQAALVRLYNHSGAHAAAAEQYAHYSRTMRELGVEPLAMSELL